jgi:hypothetical protein
VTQIRDCIRLGTTALASLVLRDGAEQLEAAA